jgi:hypothetical protein
MIFLGLDPGTSDNMALAALLDERYTERLRVLLVEPGDGKEPRDRAPRVLSSLREKFIRLALPQGNSVVLALEWQRPLEGDKRPKNICDLSAFAGIALAATQVLAGNLAAEEPQVMLPLPEEWKGQVKKHIKHNRIVAEAGRGQVTMALERAGIPVPKNLGSFTKEFTGLAGNALDAIGLALWARERSSLQDLIRRATLPRS